MEWISVDERLPELDTLVLIANNIDGLEELDVFVGNLTTHPWHDLKMWRDAFGDVVNVTHWMPLPAQPKKDGA